MPDESFSISINNVWEIVTWVLVLIIVFIPLGIVGWQGVGWLQSGVWEPYSVLQLLHDIWLVNDDWYEFPSSWIGVHRVLDWLHAGAGVMLFGIAIVALLRAVSDD